MSSAESQGEGLFKFQKKENLIHLARNQNSNEKEKEATTKLQLKVTQSEEKTNKKEEKTPLEVFAEENKLDLALVMQIESEIMDSGPGVDWKDIAGLVHVKRIIRETIIYPSLRPDIFKGVRRPARGILLFGPPGTGKTMIGKAIASQLKSTFFSISSSSLVSKWIGESEKLIK